MTEWLLGCLTFEAVGLVAYALFWRRRRDLAAHIYVHKGALWFVWLTSWSTFLSVSGHPAGGWISLGGSQAPRI